MNITGYIGSPRKSGSTAWAVNKILESAAAQGGNTQIFCAGDLEINPCKACNFCNQGGGCAIKDDMQPIYTALKTADVLVLGMPIYMGQMSGQAKVFVDRLYAYFKPRFSPTFQEEYAGKKLILVWTQGNPDAKKFKVYLDYTKMMFETLTFDVVDVIVMSGTRTNPTSEQTGLVERLLEIGQELGLYNRVRNTREEQ